MDVPPHFVAVPRGSVVALGNFDGVHHGHRSLVERALAIARSTGRSAVAATFDPHPVRFFRPDDPAFLLTSMPRRRQLLREVGVDATVALPFDAEMAQMDPAEFVDRWLGRCLDASVVVTGRNFSFGRDRAGDVLALQTLCESRGIATIAVDLLKGGSDVFSSTAIRRLLRTGDVVGAQSLLGRPFELEGRVYAVDRDVVHVDIGELLSPLAGSYFGLVHRSRVRSAGLPVFVRSSGGREVIVSRRSPSSRRRAVALAGEPVVLKLQERAPASGTLSHRAHTCSAPAGPPS